MEKELLNKIMTDRNNFFKFMSEGEVKSGINCNHHDKFSVKDYIQLDMVSEIENQFVNGISNSIDNNIIKNTYNNKKIMNTVSNCILTKEEIEIYNGIGYTVVLHPLQGAYIDTEGLNIVFSNKVFFNTFTQEFKNILIRRKPIGIEFDTFYSEMDIKEDTHTYGCTYNIELNTDNVIVLHTKKGN